MTVCLVDFFPQTSHGTIRFIPTELLQYKLIRSVFKWIDITFITNDNIIIK